MTALDLLKQSEAWDPRYSLPLVPMHNNPWIYLAYCTRILRRDGGWWSSENKQTFEASIQTHFERCSTDKLGYLKRWPEGGICSHDEILGAAYLNSAFAGDAL